MARSSKKSPAKTVEDAVAGAETATTANKSSHVATKGQTTMSDSILSFSEDISKAEAPPVLPAGEYTAEIRSVERKTSQNSGNNYLAIQFYVPSDQYPADYVDGDPDGMSMTYNRLVVEDDAKSRHRVRKFCEAIGAKMGRELNVADWVGLTATVSVKIGSWEGEDRAEIDKVVAS